MSRDENLTIMGIPVVFSDDVPEGEIHLVEIEHQGEKLDPGFKAWFEKKISERIKKEVKDFFLEEVEYKLDPGYIPYAIQDLIQKQAKIGGQNAATKDNGGHQEGGDAHGQAT